MKQVILIMSSLTLTPQKSGGSDFNGISPCEVQPSVVRNPKISSCYFYFVNCLPLFLIDEMPKAYDT